MNAAHFHLMVNHLPIVGLGFAILINLLAIIRKNDELKNLSFWFYILFGLLAILPILTGDGAGEILETYPGIDKDVIENHETWAYVFFYGLMLNGVLAIAALWFSGKKPELVKKLGIATLVIAFVLSFFAFQTGTTAGKIRHPEIEQGAIITID